MERKINSKLFIIIGILFVLSSLISNLDVRNYSEIYYTDKGIGVSKTSNKINIDGNAGWVNAKTAGICTGNGIYSEPYIIEDYVVDVEGTGWGILVENSNVYFKIINCSFSNPGFGGIRLMYVNNGQIFNNTANNNQYYGISLYLSNYNTVSGNTVNNNNYDGIQLEESNDNTVSGNTANYNNVNSWSQGISIASSNNNNISGNIVNNNIYGIHLSNSYNNVIQLNVIEGNNYGIYLMSSEGNQISNNMFSGNNIDIEGYVEPSVIIKNLVLVIGIIASFGFTGVIFLTRKQNRKEEYKVPVLSTTLRISGPALSLLGGFVQLWAAIDLPYFSPISAMFFGALVVICSFLGLFYQITGNSMCLGFGFAGPFTSFGFLGSPIYLIGTFIVICGGIAGLIGVSVKKKNYYPRSNLSFKHVKEKKNHDL